MVPSGPDQSICAGDEGYGTARRVRRRWATTRFRAIASRDDPEVRRRVDSAPPLASRPIRTGATRDDPLTYFLTVGHYVYAGDTALHRRGRPAHQRELAEALVRRGADVCARNRRGAEPLHYAADGSPGSNQWDPPAQCQVIVYLVEAGADADVLDNSGVGPLHRAVRTRSLRPRSVHSSNTVPIRDFPTRAVRARCTSLFRTRAERRTRARRSPRKNSGGSSPYCSNTEHGQRTSMRKAKRSSRPHRVTGYGSCSQTVERR